MEQFLLYLFAAVGLSHILADSSIMAPLRFWLSERDGYYKYILDMITCYQCNGFWSGLMVACIAYLGWNWLLWAFAISLISPVFAYYKLYLAMLTSVDNFEDNDEDE